MVTDPQVRLLRRKRMDGKSQEAARYFGTSPEFWMNLQQRYDLERLKDEIDERLKREIRPLPGRAA